MLDIKCWAAGRAIRNKTNVWMQAFNFQVNTLPSVTSALLSIPAVYLTDFRGADLQERKKFTQYRRERMGDAIRRVKVLLQSVES